MATVKVRIAVAVDPTGAWIARGHPVSTDESAMRAAMREVGTGARGYILTAELEVPAIVTPATIAAEVSAVESEG